MDISMYIVTHAKVDIPFMKDLEGYELLQAGDDEIPDYGYQRVNEKENISEFNYFYGEMTAYYWLWKNIECEYIGIVHYHRYFAIENHVVTKKELEEILIGHDIIIPHKYCLDQTVEDQWKTYHFSEDLEYIKESIKKMYPLQEETLKLLLETKGFHPFNFFVCKKELFDEYCEWLFPILEETRKKILFDKYPSKQVMRVGAFASERLFNVWLSMKQLKEYELDVLLYGKDAFLI